MEGIDKDLLEQSARRASRFLKTLSNESRMLVLCNLVDSEKTVSELEQILDIRQPTLSQQLARLRAEGIVATRRNGKSIHYSLASSEARALMKLLYQLFCAASVKPKRAAGKRSGTARANSKTSDHTRSQQRQ